MYNTKDVLREILGGLGVAAFCLALLFGCQETKPKVKVGSGTAYKPTGKTK